MKLAVIGLCLLGTVAAGCAALLVNALRMQAANARNMPVQASEVTVLVATRAMPAMTVVDSSYVTTRTMPFAQAPQSYVSSPVDVIGRVLARPTAEGEHFTPTSFAESGSSALVAAVIPHGKRAVGIAVTDYAGLEGLLCPGSLVDVMVSLKPREGPEGARRDAFTTTLLENIQVLAIEQQTVVSPSKLASDFSGGGSRPNDTRCITLLVDSRQAKTLELAMEEGTLSLLRNPMDSSSADRDAVWLRSLGGSDPFGPQPQAHTTSLAEVKPTVPEPPKWETIIMRPGSVETKSFQLDSGPELAKKDGE